LAVVKIFPRVLAATEPFEAAVQGNWRSLRSVVVALPRRVAQIALVPTTVVLATTVVVVAPPTKVDRIDRSSVVQIDLPTKIAQTGLPSVVLATTVVVVALPTRVDRIGRSSVVRIDSPSKIAQTDLPSVVRVDFLPVVDQIVFPKEMKIAQIPWASVQCLSWL